MLYSVENFTSWRNGSWWKCPSTYHRLNKMV